MRRRLWTIALCGILLETGTGKLRAEPAVSASYVLLEKTLDGLKVRFERVGDTYQFRFEGRPLELQRYQGGGRLLLKAAYPGQAALQALNRYNRDIAVTTRAVLYSQKHVVLEEGFECRFGVSEGTLRQFIAGFARNVAQFETFLGKQPAAGPPLHFRDESQKTFEISFPTSAAQGETAWRIVWDMETAGAANREGFKFPKDRAKDIVLFRIKKAFFRPGAQAPWVQVLEDAHASEFYVPYFNFPDTFFFDLTNVGNYVPLLAREGGARGRLLGTQKLVMAELRDRGLAYKHGNVSRRAEGLALWANFEAGNYTYLVEIVFHDDGTIVFRHAPTGFNLREDFDNAAHMHNCLWRLGVRLRLDEPGKTTHETPARNEVQVTRLRYDPKGDGHAGAVDYRPVPRETFVDWDAKEFTSLRVSNPDVRLLPYDAKNPERNLPISYDLIALQQGQTRHLRAHEKFCEHDFYVTRPDSAEKMSMYLHEFFAKKSQLRPLAGADGVVLWHMSSSVHIPRGEDGILRGADVAHGQALVQWTTVELRPRNLFAATPLYRARK
jgi:hypothetical protein